MGCNTSQELTAKDASVHVLNGSKHENDANDVIEQNANNEMPLQQKAAVSNTISATNNTTTIANKMHDDDKKSPNSNCNTAIQNNLIKSNSNAMQLSNGDNMNHHNNASKKTTTTTSISKENGLLPIVVNGLPNDDISSVDTQRNVDDTALADDETTAAIKIQAVYRGHKARNNMKKANVKNNCSSICNSNNSKNRTTVASATADDTTRADLEAEFDPNDKELCDAARKIQATFRGHLTRKLIVKDADVDINELTQKVAEELDIDLNDPELNKAATKIQASFRGHKIRKECAPVPE